MNFSMELLENTFSGPTTGVGRNAMLTFGIQDLGKWLGDEVDAATGAADPNSSGPGARFLSRATDMEYIGKDRDLAVRTIESAARFAELGAVARMTMAASEAAGGAVTWRTHHLGHPPGRPENRAP